MSPTIFDASQKEEREKREQLEKEIEELKREAQQKTATSLPAREENNQSVLQGPTPPEEEELPIEPPSSLAAPEPESAQERETMKDTTSSTSPEKRPESIDVTEAESSKTNRQPEEYSELLRTHGPTSNPLAAFSVQPVDAHFVSQHANEKILMVLRQHPIVNLRWVLIVIVMMVVPFTILPLFPIFTVIPSQHQLFAFIGWYLLTTAFTIQSFLHWYFNLYIITDERIVDIDFYSLIYRSISSAKVENIEDTTATTKGVLGAIFNYGDVTIQTAGEKREFEFASVPQPATVTKFINELILEEEREKLEGRVM